MSESGALQRQGLLQQVPFNDLKRLYMRYAEQVEHAVLQTLRTGWWLNGERTKSFAESFAAHVHTPYCIAVANGTDALELAIRAAAKQRPGRTELVTVANAGGYSTTAARAANLVPVYADVELHSQVLDIDSALQCFNDQTTAVVATHLYGNTVDVAALRRALNAAGHRDALIIEDCAQCHGAMIGSEPAGSLGDMAAFSFYPTKNLGAMGDAGAVLTGSHELAQIVSSLHQYGWQGKYCITDSGGRNSRMDEIQAAILSVLLPHLDDMNAERKRILNTYRAATPPDVEFIHAGGGSVVHLAVILSQHRDALRSHLREHGIATEIHYPVLDCDQSAWQSLPYRIAAGGLENSRKGTKSTLSLPCFVGMTAQEIDRVSDALSTFKAP